MPPEPKGGDLAFVWDMLRFARTTRQIVKGRTYKEFCKNIEFRLAVERSIEIVGEAARNVSTEIQEDHADVPWRLIRTQRHVLAHDYGDIMPDKIWNVATVKIPSLNAQLEPMLPPEDRDTPTI